jgi:hypothetical protein
MGDVRLTNPIWDSSSLIEQPAVVRFVTLMNISAKDIRPELEELYGHEALSFLGDEEVAKGFR